MRVQRGAASTEAADVAVHAVVATTPAMPARRRRRNRVREREGIMSLSICGSPWGRSGRITQHQRWDLQPGWVSEPETYRHAIATFNLVRHLFVTRPPS